MRLKSFLRVEACNQGGEGWAMKRAGSSKKVSCRRLGSTAKSRFYYKHLV